MEFLTEIAPELFLSELRSTFPLSLLENWNIESYYEAIGLDLEEQEEIVTNENDDQ